MSLETSPKECIEVYIEGYVKNCTVPLNYCIASQCIGCWGERPTAEDTTKRKDAKNAIRRQVLNVRQKNTPVQGEIEVCEKKPHATAVADALMAKVWVLLHTKVHYENTTSIWYITVVNEITIDENHAHQMRGPWRCWWGPSGPPKRNDFVTIVGELTECAGMQDENPLSLRRLVVLQSRPLHELRLPTQVYVVRPTHHHWNVDNRQCRFSAVI